MLKLAIQKTKIAILQSAITTAALKSKLARRMAELKRQGGKL